MEGAGSLSKYNSRQLGKYNLETFPKAAVEAPQSETVSLTLRVDANYKVTGRSSGQSYLFSGAGSTLDVNKQDVEFLLNLRQGKGCCGGGDGNPIFQLTGE